MKMNNTVNAYWRLMRFDKPIGILLLWYPAAWALWLANQGRPPLALLCLFLLGTIVMRAAGCVINDIADRNLDKYITRTHLRPLTSGEISLTSALILLAILLLIALIILVSLPKDCLGIALIAVAITFIYPFCKRFFNAPQLILGLAFSMGIPMVYVASGVPFNTDFVLLMVMNFMWIVAYDTMYAMTDKQDDLKIGIKSTAIYFAQYDLVIIGSLLFTMHALWLCCALLNKASVLFYVFWLGGGIVLLYQGRLIAQRIPEQCFRSFLISNYYGCLMWLALIVK